LKRPSAAGIMRGHERDGTQDEANDLPGGDERDAGGDADEE
jgi:hypothetical protein